MVVYMRPAFLMIAYFRFWLNGFASIKWTVELSPYCPLLEIDWADITDVPVSALAIVEALDIVEHLGLCLVTILIRVCSKTSFPPKQFMTYN